MNILNSISNAIKGLASKVAGFVSGSSQTASAGMSFPLLPGTTLQGGTVVQNQTPIPNQSTPYGPGVGYGGGTAVLNSSGQTTKILTPSGGSVPIPSSAYPSPIYAPPPAVTIGGGSNRSTTQSASQKAEQSLAPQQAVQSFGGSPTIGVSNLSAGATSPFTAPAAPGSPYVSGVDNSHLISGYEQAGYSYDPKTGQYSRALTDQEKVIEAGSIRGKILDLLPKEESALDSPEVRAQQERVNQLQRDLAGPTAQLNTVVAEQQRRLLETRKTGMNEGVTETVYGNQERAINYDAAIRALPLQAQIASIQGDLSLAQDYLTQLTTWKTEQLKNEYNYKKDLFSLAYDFADKDQQRALAKLDKQEDRAYEEKQDFIALQDSWAKEAVSKGQGNLVSQIHGARNRDELARVVSGIVVPTQGQYTEKQGKVIDQIDTGVSNSFNYKAVNSAKGFADGVLASLNQGSGLGDIAAINQFQKVIDEGAVTREQDVTLVQSSQSLANSLKLKIKKLEKGDQLSSDQREEMRETVTKLYEAKVRSLEDDPYIKSQILKAERNSIDTADTILGQLGVYKTSSATRDVQEVNGVRYVQAEDGLYYPE